MRKPCLAAMLAAVLAVVLAAGSWAKSDPPGPQKWNFFIVSECATTQGTDAILAMLQRSKESGVTHLLICEGNMHKLPAVNAEYLQNLEKIKAAAKDMGIVLAPYICHTGYCGRYLGQDGNLAAGLPVKDLLMVVEHGVAKPDPSETVDLNGLQRRGAYLNGVIKVKPFHSYYLTVSTKQYPKLGDYLAASSKDGRKYMLMSPALTVDGAEGYFIKAFFNSLENTEINLQIADKAPIVDLKIEPAGLMLILRRDLVPLTVASEDGQTVYQEGQDYKPLADPELSAKPFRGRITITHDAAVIELTPNSRIKEGQKLKVSFWHAYRNKDDQTPMSMEDPRAMDILTDEIKNVVKVWNTGHYVLDYEEMRIAGWEPQPNGENLKPGELLAHHFRKTYDAVRQADPKAVVYTWSDMFCPGHNARPYTKEKGYYYLINGDWSGSWEGFPKDVIVLNWFSPDEKNVKFFADRGLQQVFCQITDGLKTEEMKTKVATWRNNARGVQGVLGWMYISYNKSWNRMPEFFHLIDTFDQWSATMPSPATKPAEKPPGETQY